MKEILICIVAALAVTLVPVSGAVAEGGKKRAQELQEAVNDTGTVCETGVTEDYTVTTIVVDEEDAEITIVCNPVADGLGAPQ